MIRAIALAEAGRYDERYLSAEDYELFLRLSRTHSLAVLPKVLTTTRYDLHGISLRQRRRQQWSRLRCQIRYFDASTWYSFLGLARTLGALMTPRSLASAWKQRRAH
jgi:hypothetical protein